MSTKVVEPPVFAYQIIETIGESGMHYSTLLNHEPLIERYVDVSKLAGEAHKLIALQIVATEKTYSSEEGDDFKLTLTKRGMIILKNLQNMVMI